MRNDWIRCAVKCAVCGKDQWYPNRGHHECACGQHLWVERTKDENGGIHFPYRQGLTTPDGYKGTLEVTK